MSYQVEVVWNREFDFRSFGEPHADMDRAIAAAQSAQDLGDGACVKKARVVDQDGRVVWAYGKKVVS